MIVRVQIISEDIQLWTHFDISPAQQHRTRCLWECNVREHCLSLIEFNILAEVVQSLSHVWLFVTPWTVALQALSMWFPRQEYWSDLPFPSPGDLPDPGIKPCFLHWQVDSLLLSHQGSPRSHHIFVVSLRTQQECEWLDMVAFHECRSEEHL